MPASGQHGRLRPFPAERPHLTRCTRHLCSACLSLLLVAGVLLFVLYLAIRPHRPRFHLTAFAASGIPSGPVVIFSGQLSIHNPNHDIGFYFEHLYGSVYYKNSVVGSHRDLTGGPLFQPPNSTILVGFDDPVSSISSVVIGEMGRDLESGSVGFTVKVRSSIRVKTAVWGTHWHPMHVSCDVVVGSDGQMLAEYREKRCDIYFF